MDKSIPSSVVYEDEKILAFRDITPRAPTHILVIPKKKGNLDMLQHAKPEDAEILGYMLLKVGEIARQQKLDNGYRVVINNGRDAG